MASNKVFKIVLTGGPCAGKTTGQVRLGSFFDSLGWRVYCVPETATIILSGGVKFYDLNPEETLCFQENLLRTMIQVEKTFFDLAKTCQQNCLIICDRGLMDVSAYMSTDDWKRICEQNNWNVVQMLDVRYNHVVHLVTAAVGAEDFYTIDNNSVRSEGLAKAIDLDNKCSAAWVGHPYLDVIDNSTGFEMKINRLIECVCHRVGIETGDQFSVATHKLKFLLIQPPPSDDQFPSSVIFNVVCTYLQSPSGETHRVQKRGHKKKWNYTLTVQRGAAEKKVIVRTHITRREYINHLLQEDPEHFSIAKRRRCFLYNNYSFQLDTFLDNKRNRPKCRNLHILQIFTTLCGDEALNILPPFLQIEREVTGDPQYRMFNLSLKNDWCRLDTISNDS